MEEIKEGEYVRTENGLIGKVNKIEPAGSGCRFAGEFLIEEIVQFNDGKTYERRIKRRQVVSHSKNIIELIKIGDIVVILDAKFNSKDCVFIGDIEMLEAVRDDTKIRCKLLKILTKEQFEQNCYKLD